MSLFSNTLTAPEKIIRAKVQLQMHKPFFGYLLMALDIKPDNSIETAAIDMISYKLMYNEKWVASLTEKEIEGLLCHEVMHIALGHGFRRGDRSPEAFNVANDAIINDILVVNGLDLPKNGIIPQNHIITLGGKEIKNLDKKSSEQVYDELPKDMKKNIKIKIRVDGKIDGGESDDGKGKKGFDVHIYGDKIPQKQKEKLEKEIKERLTEALTVSRSRGIQPLGLDGYIQELLEPRVSWREKLWREMSNAIISDYSWMRSSKKSQGCGIYLPGTVRESIEAVVHIDTSGSCYNEAKEFMSEVSGFLKSFPHVKMDLILCDAEIQSVDEITAHGNTNDLLKVKIRGGGGTSHKSVWEWVQKNRPNCRIFISLTDLYSDQMEMPRIANTVLWVTPKGCENQKVPFGEIVVIDRSKGDD